MRRLATTGAYLPGPERARMTITERAYTSPIWYTPE